MTEPDYRFTLANERTFLAHVRTALSFLAGGVALGEASTGTVQRVVAVGAILTGAGLGASAYPRWRRADAAIRAGAPLPRSRSLLVVSVVVALLGGGALVAVVGAALR